MAAGVNVRNIEQQPRQTQCFRSTEKWLSMEYIFWKALYTVKCISDAILDLYALQDDFVLMEERTNCSDIYIAQRKFLIAIFRIQEYNVLGILTCLNRIMKSDLR